MSALIVIRILKGSPTLKLPALLLVLISAIIHASWNLIMKRSRNKQAFIWWTMVVIVTIYLPLFFVYGRGVSGYFADKWYFPVMSGFFQCAYCILLAHAYEQGDLSIVYPVSRGLSPILIAVFAYLFLHERISMLEIAGIGIVVLGVYVLHLQSLKLSDLIRPIKAVAHRRDSQLAIVLGGVISGYHLIDKKGIEGIHPFAYLYLVQVVLLVMLSLFTIPKIGWKTLKLEWKLGKGWIILVAILCFLAYLLILFAMNIAQVNYIGAVRNVSIVVATLFGVLVLKEGFMELRLPASILVVVGIIILTVG